MTNITIKKTEGTSGGKFVAHIEGQTATGELTWSRVNENLIIADHTGVDDALRGMGIAKALVEHLIADARENNYRIVPLCPYVRAQSMKHPEWDDVVIKN
ncbi:MAG: N-acetyltransferase [Parvularculaceae bacterium]|nr:N-acetyltransferase [Parvularculaceae bacterium]